MSNDVDGAVVVSRLPDCTQVSLDGLVDVETPWDLIERMVNHPDLDRQEQDR